MTLNTNVSSDELVKEHTYTVHSANEPHIHSSKSLGRRQRKRLSTATNGGADIKSLGNGTFIIPICSALKQCVDLEFVDIINGKANKARSIRKPSHGQTQPPNSEPVVIIILSIALVSMALFICVYIYMRENSVVTM